ncbi:hypothetical protein [Halioxenophilus aromaticivorans]|uniref:Uncharacterized protein n=1 Tax=Halioxenophilus aromaticivorans TaxID=1306992 RepID=A0AAV3U9X4_9ALTE
MPILRNPTQIILALYELDFAAIDHYQQQKLTAACNAPRKITLAFAAGGVQLGTALLRTVDQTNGCWGEMSAIKVLN